MLNSLHALSHLTFYQLTNWYSPENKINKTDRTFLLYSGSGLVVKLCLTLEIPWTVIHKAPLFVGFSRQEYWTGLPFPSPISII